MADRFAKQVIQLDSPAVNGVEITPGNTELDQTTRSLYIGGEGNVCVLMAANTVLTFASVPAGTILPIRVDKVFANTTATSIVGIY